MKEEFRDDITGLRALAVLAVVATHFSSRLLPGGALGVDTFFVVSGFVITRSIAARASGRGFFAFLADFYARRVRRLGPALLANVLGTSALYVLISSSTKMGLVTGAASLVGLANLYLLYKSSDYFAAPALVDPSTHTWSLGVEEQFYLLYPPLAFALLVACSGRARRLFVPALVVLLAASLAAYALVEPRSPVVAFYASPLRFWELATGCLLARLPDTGNMRRRLAPVAMPAALVALLACFATPYEGNVLHLAAAVAASAGLIAFGGGRGPVDRLLLSPPAQYLGRISYSLYLWHWSVLSLSRLTVGIGWALAPFQFAAMLSLAHLSHVHVERRLMRGGREQGPRSFVALAKVSAVLAASLATLLALAYPFDGSLFIGRRAPLLAQGPESMAMTVAGPGGGHWIGTRCLVRDSRDLFRTIDLDRDCTLGNPAAPRRILVLGNSYGSAYLEAVRPLAADPRNRVSLVAAFGASGLPGMEASFAFARESDYYWDKVVPPALARLARGDVVLLVTATQRLVDDDPDPSERRELADYLARLHGLAARLRAKGVNVAVLYGTPMLYETECSPDQSLEQWFAPAARPCQYLTHAETAARLEPKRRGLEAMAAAGEIATIDVLDDLCPGTVCDFDLPDGTFLFRDEYSHVSIRGARHVAPSVRRQLYEGLERMEAIAAARRAPA